MKLKLRLLSFLLVFTIAAGNLLQVPVYADEKTAAPSAGMPENRETVKNEKEKELTDLEITDLSEPVAGKELDAKATVRSAEGVTWEIPVVWIGEDGKAASVAEPGKKYVPNFAFYVPKGYKVKGTGAGGRINIKLPKFLESLGMDQLLFVADPSNGLTYITWDLTKVLGPSVLPAVYYPSDPENKEAQKSESDKTDEDKDDDDDDDDDNDKPPFWEVNVHCTQNLIANVGYEVLASLVSLIKNEIEPRAVAALMEGFPAFSDAADNGELGTYIGLYIYDARFDSWEEDVRNIAIAGAYTNYVYDGYELYYLLGVNSKNILTLNNSGVYELNDEWLDETNNNIIHELMHALMYDYTRTGMTSNDNYLLSPEEPGEVPYKSGTCFPYGLKKERQRQFIMHSGITIIGFI